MTKTYTAQEIIEQRKALWADDPNINRDQEFRDSVADALVNDPSLRREVADRPQLLIEMLMIVVSKEKQTMPFFLNTVQHMFFSTLDQALADYRSGTRLVLRFLLLKGRQQGFTTAITAYQLACSVTRKNFEGFTAADDDSNASTIFENKAKYPYNALPEATKPTEKLNNKKQLLFDKLNSSWEVKTASRNMGRSRTINFMHGSEVAFWKDGISGVQAGLGEAMTKDAVQIYESTANGYNEYKDLWDSGTWINCFYAWWLTDEYRMAFESAERRAAWLAEMQELATLKKWIGMRCMWLLNDVGLDPEQVYWYYNKWNGYLDKEMIKQEYPCSDQEAFLASGRPVFAVDKIVMRIEDLRRLYKMYPPERGRFAYEWANPETQDRIRDETIKWVPDESGEITIYRRPTSTVPYVIGGDTKGEGRDKYAATVIDNTNGMRVASLHMAVNHSKPYTWQMYCLGRYYNTALVGIEMNFNTAPIEELERLKYPLQYVRQKYDSMGKPVEKKFGWKTDGNTRPLIIDKEIGLIDSHIELFTHIDFLSEALTFVYDKNGRPDAESGKHDDLLISDMIANEIRTQQSFTVAAIDPTPVPVHHAFRTEADTPTGGDYIEW